MQENIRMLKYMDISLLINSLQLNEQVIFNKVQVDLIGNLMTVQPELHDFVLNSVKQKLLFKALTWKQNGIKVS